MEQALRDALRIFGYEKMVNDVFTFITIIFLLLVFLALLEVYIDYRRK